MAQEEPAPTFAFEQASAVIAKGAPIATVPMCSTSVPAFVTTTGWLGDVVPTTWLPKARLDGDSDTAGWIPLPDTATTCGELSASSLNDRLACSGPSVAGANPTCTVQVAPSASVVPVQVSADR